MSIVFPDILETPWRRRLPGAAKGTPGAQTRARAPVGGSCEFLFVARELVHLDREKKMVSQNCLIIAANFLFPLGTFPNRAASKYKDCD